MSCQHERTKTLWEEPSHSRDIGEINWCIDCGAYRRWSGSENEVEWVQPSRDRETGAPVRFREHADMRQDERLRALERELARSGKTIYEWAAAVLDVQPTFQLRLQPRTIIRHMHDGIHITIQNETNEARNVDVSMGRPTSAYGSAGVITREQTWRRGRCPSCLMVVGVSRNRFLILEHTEQNIRRLCSGSGKVTTALECRSHGVVACRAAECRHDVFVPTCRDCDGRGNHWFGDRNTGHESDCTACNGTGTVCCGLGGELHSAICECCQGRCAHAR